MIEIKDIEFDSELFSIKKLANGIFALIEKEKGKTGSNAGIIEIGDRVIVFDTFLNIDATEELKKACLDLTGKLPSLIINSHSHPDHIIGNCLFTSYTKIISSKGARKEIENFKSEFEQEKHIYSERVEEINDNLIKTDDKIEILNLKNELSFVSSFAKPNVYIRVPDTTFEKEMIFHSEEKSLYLNTYEIGHSIGDVLAYIPEAKICFTGDLLFVESHPWLGSGDPEQNIMILEELLKLDIEYFVPGHGRIATKKDIKLQIQYIREMIELVKSKKSTGDAKYSVDELSSVFNGWRDLCFQWNIDFLLGRK